MRLLLGWTVQLGFLAAFYLTMTGKLDISLPETVMGFEVPAVARQWVDRNAEIAGYARQTRETFRQIGDKIR
jgi:hypothetical protein